MSRWPPLRERLFSKLTITASGCVLWTGNCDRDGYGHIYANGRRQKVHRVMWEMFAGPIPEGLVIDHVKARGCIHRNCVSLAHLEPVTIAENALRGDTVIVMNAAKTACPAGHEYDLLNTYWAKGAARQCRACGRDRAREYRRRQAAKRRAEANALEAAAWD